MPQKSIQPLCWNVWKTQVLLIIIIELFRTVSEDTFKLTTLPYCCTWPIFNRLVHLTVSHQRKTVLHDCSRTHPELPTSNWENLLCLDLQDIIVNVKLVWKDSHRKPSDTGLIRYYSDELECAHSTIIVGKTVCTYNKEPHQNISVSPQC